MYSRPLPSALELKQARRISELEEALRERELHIMQVRAESRTLKEEMHRMELQLRKCLKTKNKRTVSQQSQPNSSKRSNRREDIAAAAAAAAADVNGPASNDE